MKKKLLVNLIFTSLILLFISVFFLNLFYPKLQFFATPDFGQSDLWMFNFPLKFFLSQSLQNNQLPLWSKDIGSGFPLFAESQIAALNPVNLFLFKFFSFPVAFNLMYPFTFLTSAVGTYFFCRTISLTRLTSFYTGIIFSFSGFFIAHITHPNLIQAASSMPWMFLFTYRLSEKQNKINLALLALTVTVSLFSGFAQITFAALIGISLFIFFLLIKRYKNNKNINDYIKRSILTLILFTASVTTGFIIASAQLIPTLEFLGLSQRANGFSLSAATYYSFPPIHLLTLFDPFALGNPAMGTYPPFASFDGSVFWENTGYMGVLPLILCIFSIFIIKKNRFIIFFWILLLFSTLLMLGKFSPLRSIHVLPFFSFFHVPSRYILLFVWAFAILAGICLNYFEEILKRRTALLAYPVILLFAVISFLNIFYVWKNYHALIPVSDLLSPPETALSIKDSKKRILSVTAANAWNKIFLSEGWDNINPYLYLRNSLRQNINLLYGIPQANVYAGSNTQRSSMFTGIVFLGIKLQEQQTSINDSSLKLLKLQGIGNIITASLADENRFEKLKTIEDKNFGLPNFYVYRITPMNRAFMVYKKIIAEKNDVQKILLSPNFDPSDSVILEKDDKVKISGPKASPKVDIIEDKNNSVKLSIKNNPAAGYLVLADTYYPGWKAFVNGVETEILAANLNQRAIFLPSGNHTVLFQYNPLSFLIGKYITAVSLIITFLLLTFSKQILIPVKKLLGK